MTAEKVVIGPCTLILGDCIEVLPSLDQYDAVVCDPPYGLEFMGKEWDAPWQTSSKSALFGKRATATPGFGSTRNANCQACGGRMRGAKKCSCDQPAWDEPQASTVSRQMQAFQVWCLEWAAAALRVLKPGGHLLAFGGTRTYHRLACAVEDAGFEVRDQIGWMYGSGFPKSHNLPGGLGTALKPAWEPIIVARKPLIGTVAANVAKHGTGALNIDACRVPCEPIRTTRNTALGVMNDDSWQPRPGVFENHPAGRWPANVIHDGSEEVLACFPETASGMMKAGTRRAAQDGPGSVCYGTYGGDATAADTFGDTGTAARFFYCAKASQDERGEGNTHPTVKPVELIKYLVKLVAPMDGTVLDPFGGSGTTAVACIKAARKCILIERDPAYLAIAAERVRAAWAAEDAALYREGA